MQRAESLEHFLALLDSMRNPKGVCVVAIGGLPGSGKTTLLKWLRDKVQNCEGVSTDWLVGQTSETIEKKISGKNQSNPLEWEDPALLKCVLDALTAGENYKLERTYTPDGGVRQADIELVAPQPGGILFVEGIEVFHPAVAEVVTHKVMIEIPFVQSTRQFIQRQHGVTFVPGKDGALHQERLVTHILLHPLQCSREIASLIRARTAFCKSVDIIVPHELVPHPVNIPRHILAPRHDPGT